LQRCRYGWRATAGLPANQQADRIFPFDVMHEERLTDQVLSGIVKTASAAADEYQIDMDRDLPGGIVAKLDARVVAAQNGQQPYTNIWDDLALPIGSIWGQLLCEKFRWEWTMVLSEGKKMPGVFDPNRALGAYPFDYIFECVKHGNEVNIELAYNMLITGERFDFASKRSYTDVMKSIGRIVP
jgi:hypothetical protein